MAGRVITMGALLDAAQALHRREARRINEIVVGGLVADDPGPRRKAMDNLNRYLRERQRTDGYARRHYDVVEISPAGLQEPYDRPLPVKIRYRRIYDRG